MSRTQRRLARKIVPRRKKAVTLHVGEIVSVTGTTASIYLNAKTDVEVGPVPVTPGLTVAAGQVVEVTFLGQAPTITRRIT